MRRTIPLFAALALVWGCDGATAPDGQFGSANVVFTLSSSGGSGGAFAVAPAALFAQDADGGNIPRELIDGIWVTVTGVQVLRADEEGGWIPVDLVLAEGETGIRINLLELDAAGVPIAAGDLDVTDYVDARLFIADPVIELNDGFCLGDGSADAIELCLSEGENDNVMFPSATETGIKTDAQFSVDDETVEQVDLDFNSEATIESITHAPGLGAVVVSPVIRAADADAGAGAVVGPSGA